MPPPTRRRRPTPDRHVLYQKAVQSPDVELDFVDRVFRKLRGRRPNRLREDFCGTALLSCEWARRRPANTALGLDLHTPTLRWAREHNVAALPDDARERVRLVRRNVLNPGPGASAMDVVLAMNFSWRVFQARPLLLDYFRTVRRSLKPGGLFILDIFGGYEAEKDQKDRTQVGGKKRGFLYVWDQTRFDPITNRSICRIHFMLKGRRWIRNAFTYDWRYWTLPETRDVLADAGFKRTTIYWEGDDSRGGGNGIFRPTEHAEQYPSWIAYIVAEP